ncbi:MAG: UTP--glucose-1-phosphate uridylyltransferase [Candidatus Hydrogenedentota bacterium]
MNINKLHQVFEELKEKFVNGEFTFEDNIIKGKIEPPSVKDFLNIKRLDETIKKKYFEKGKDAIKNNRLGCVIMNGGMATRFGSGVKGIVEVYDGKSFLQIKLEKIKRVMAEYNAVVEIFIMNSFATAKQTTEYLTKNSFFGIDKNNIHFFNQYKFPRLRSDGSFFTSSEKEENNYYGPGHGDFIYTFRESGLLDNFVNSGGSYLWYSNVDNLGSTIDPVILGAHIESICEMTVELAEKVKGDKGGAPAIVNNKLQIVEGFQFPETFNQDSITIFNTATYIFNAGALNKDVTLPFYVVKKNVEGVDVIQFERLTGDLSVFLECFYIIVPREERFFPIKTKEDLENQREKLKERFEKD